MAKPGICNRLLAKLALMFVVVVDLMGQGIRNPFFIAIYSAMLAIALMAILWQSPKMRRLTQKPAS